MTIRLFRPCFFSGWLYPGALFRIKTTEKILCLTFDDGPDPATTQELLDILDYYQVKAMFFCSGEAAEKYPHLIEKIKEEGHIIGNHGFAHLDGWKSNTKDYCENVAHASLFLQGTYFRPPYGHITQAQHKELSKKYKIVFWDLMAYDFDANFSAERTLALLRRKIRKGSVIVLHDKRTSTANEIMKEFLDSSISKGYRFTLP